jgi:hypothetical protein
LENKVKAVLHGWQPMHIDELKAEVPLCQPLSCRRVRTIKRNEDAFRVRAIGLTTGFNDDSASPYGATIKPDLRLEFEIMDDEEDD